MKPYQWTIFICSLPWILILSIIGIVYAVGRIAQAGRDIIEYEQKMIEQEDAKVGKKVFMPDGHSYQEKE